MILPHMKKVSILCDGQDMPILPSQSVTFGTTLWGKCCYVFDHPIGGQHEKKEIQSVVT